MDNKESNPYGGQCLPFTKVSRPNLWSSHSSV